MSDEQERLNEEAVDSEEMELEEEQPETEEEPDDGEWKKGLIAVGIITAVGFIGGLLTGLGVKKSKEKKEAEE